MIFNFYGLYVPRECLSNNIEMAEDGHVPEKAKYMDLAEDNIEAVQSVIIVVLFNVVISSQLDRTCGRSSSINVAIHHIARTVIFTFNILSLA